ncbi:hypothetical protein D3C72_1952640 [compost metagenome]
MGIGPLQARRQQAGIARGGAQDMGEAQRQRLFGDSRMRRDALHLPQGSVFLRRQMLACQRVKVAHRFRTG